MGKYHVVAVLTMMLSQLYYPAFVLPLIIIIVTCSCSVKENFMEACHEFWITLVPKLKYEHVYLNYFSKMRVDLVAQVIN